MVSLTAPVLRVLQEVPRSRDDPHMFLGQNGKDAPVERPLVLGAVRDRAGLENLET